VSGSDKSTGNQWRATVAIHLRHSKSRALRLRFRLDHSVVVPPDSPEIGKWLYRTLVRPALIDMELPRYSARHHTSRHVKKVGESNE